MPHQIDELEKMTVEEETAFWDEFALALDRDDGAAVRDHLAAGNPVYYNTLTTPRGVVEKHYPDGRRELVMFDLDGEHLVSVG
jgi:hypothetical protein